MNRIAFIMLLALLGLSQLCCDSNTAQKSNAFNSQSPQALSDEIFIAAKKGELGKVKSLVAKDPELVNAKGRNAFTPLHFAAYGGHKAVVEFLISKGADVNAKDNYGITPLHYATAMSHPEVAAIIRAHGGTE